jgi:citrate/tricarballylate utilization protein
VFVLLAIGIGVRRFWRDIAGEHDPAPRVRDLWRAIREGVTLRHLHATGLDCVSGEESRTPWRRWWHHATLGGFLLCFASTSVAALYHSMFGWQAPYEWSSLPVMLGTIGGAGLVVGPFGQWWERLRRDPSLADPAQRGMDDALLILLWLTSVSGLALLVLRERELMPALLLVHLGIVMALFVAMPYGKFVHGFYRVVALARDKAEGKRQER